MSICVLLVVKWYDIIDENVDLLRFNIAFYFYLGKKYYFCISNQE